MQDQLSPETPSPKVWVKPVLENLSAAYHTEGNTGGNTADGSSNVS